MSKVLFLLKALCNFVYVSLTPFLSHNYAISFTKEEDGKWYVDLKNWAFAHRRLQMVCGADKLCEEFNDGNGHAHIQVFTSNHLLKNLDGNAIRCDREWAYLKWGGQYNIGDNEFTKVKEIWLCQVTLFVIGWWPKYLYITK